MFNFSSDPTITYCTFIANEASGGGGMFSTDASLPTLEFTGFCNNSPDQVIGAFIDAGGNSLLNCPPPIPVPASCPADIIADSQVNVSDLLALLAGWGPCP